MKIRCFWIAILFGLSGPVIHSQEVDQAPLDSLNLWVSSQLEGTKDTFELYNVAHQALNIAKEAAIRKSLVNSLQNLSSYHQSYGHLDSAIYYVERVLEINKQEKEPEIIAETHLALKDLYNAKADYGAAQVQVFAALELYEASGDQKGIAHCYTHLCDLLYYEDKYQESIDYCDKAIEIQEQLDDPRDLALSYRYKASSQLFADGQLEDALENVNKAIEIYNQIGETEIPLLASINGRGNILKYMERYEQAVTDYKMIYERSEALGIERYAIPSLANIGHVYILQQKFEEALPYHLEAVDRMKKTGNTRNLWENYMHITTIYENTGKYEEALRYNKLFTDEYEKYLYTIIDRLENENQVKYETAKKDAMIGAQENTIATQRRVQILYLSVALLLITSLIGMFLSRKRIKKKQAELEKSRKELKASLDNLKSTQAQLIHSEKMASLGELTAGIAHEIQNPLNFINNFSELNKELLSELNEEIDNENYGEVKSIADDVIKNEQKILHHGKRADSIVKGMLQHSRTGSGVKEPTDINALCDEYIRLAYHGLRAKDKSFNATFKTDLDRHMPKIPVVSQDIGRVLLNLINNAFHAVDEKAKTSGNLYYKPSVKITTRNISPSGGGAGGGGVTITISDNGPGIPDEIKDKIFQPFFTTKPTGEGTGLGLSLAYDIVKAHGGAINVDSSHGVGTNFIIFLPLT